MYYGVGHIYSSVMLFKRNLKLFKHTISQIAHDLVIADEERAEKYFYYKTIGIV